LGHLKIFLFKEYIFLKSFYTLFNDIISINLKKCKEKALFPSKTLIYRPAGDGNVYA